MIIFRNSIQDGNEVLLLMLKIASDDILESLYKLRIRESAQLKTVLELYDMEIHKKIPMPNYQTLKTMVKRRKDQKLRFRNFDARHWRIETGAVVKNRKGMSGVEGGKGHCYQWKGKGQCSDGEQCSFWHESNDRAQKPEHTAASPSEPSMTRGRSVSKKRSIKGKSNHGAILRQPCRYYLKGTCTRSPCEYWHPPECQFNKNRNGCKTVDKCLFQHHKVDEQPNKKPKKGYHSPQKKESDDNNAVAIVKIEPQLSCVSQDSDALVSQRGKQSGETRCKKSWDQFEKCGEGELVSGVHTLVWRSVQVYHELHQLKEEDKGREEMQETEKESQVEEKRSHEDDHVDMCG